MHNIRTAAQEVANKTRDAHHPKSIYGSVARKAGFIDGASWGATYAMENNHMWCNCVPDLGPPHCHFCSRELEKEVSWEDCESVKAVLGGDRE